jgi:hypothetical protein
MSRFIRIRTPRELLAAIHRNPIRFLILLNYGGQSSKRIRYDPRRKVFKIQNLIDGRRQALTARQLMKTSRSNIGPAMKAGSFYAQVA